MDVTKKIQNDLVRAVRYFLVPGHCVEIRALNLPGTKAKIDWDGYFDNAELAAAAIQHATENNAEGVYITLNPLRSDVLARRANRIEYANREFNFATDADATRLAWMLIDADPIRPSGISSTDEEKNLAIETAKQILKFLTDRGFHSILAADSGNGIHLLVKIDLPVTDAIIVKNCLRAIDAKFRSEHVKIDTVNFNPGRITKAYGSIARKGDSIEGRPHRKSQLLDSGKMADGWDNPVGRDLLVALAAEAPEEPKRRGRQPAYAGQSHEKMHASPEQVRAYMASYPPAISGQNGHSRTMAAACVLVLKFDLSPEEAMPYFEEWNQTCQPPWSERDLERKLFEADKKDGVRGELINTGLDHAPGADTIEFDFDTSWFPAPTGSSTLAGEKTVTQATMPDYSAPPAEESPPEQLGPNSHIEIRELVDDPHRLAKAFLQRRHTYKGLRTLQFWDQGWWLWDGAKYYRLSDKQIRPLVNAFCKEEVDRQYRQRLTEGGSNKATPTPTKVTNRLVLDVIGALQGMCFLRDPSIGLNCWLGEDGQAHRRNWVALNNGIFSVDVAVGRGKGPLLIPHDPRWFSTVSLGFAYDPAATCPRFQRFLESSLEGDEEIKRFLQEWTGYELIPNTDLQKFVILEGEGSNGKSVFLAATEALLGKENVSHVPLELFGQRFQLGSTIGKLANICADCGELDAVAEGHLKSFVSGDQMMIDRKGIDPLDVTPTARLIIATNNRPRFSDKSSGIFRRLVLIPWNRTIPDSEKIPGMDKVDWWLARPEELSGIFNWALIGLQELLAEGRFTIPEASRSAMEEYRLENNHARAFLLETFEPSTPESFVAVQKAYEAYVAYCKANGHIRVLNVNNFGKEVKRAFKNMTKDRAGPRSERFSAYFGIKTLEDAVLPVDF